MTIAKQTLNPANVHMIATDTPRRRPRLMRAACLLIICCATVACGGDPDGASTNDAIRSTSTTVGDTLVVRTTGAIPDAGTHVLTERWRVGDVDGVDSTISFGGINGFALHTDGTVAVFDVTGPTLRTYDAQGQYMRTIGRKGAGPGEYSQSNGIAYLPDGRLAFWDPSTARITLYNADGSVQNEWQPPVTGVFRSDALHPVSTHTIAIESTVPQVTADGEPPPRGPRPTAYFLYDSTGIITDTLIVPLPAEEPLTLTAENENMSMVMGLPFAPAAHSALRPDGRLALAFGRDYRIRISNGEQPLRVERSAPTIPTTDDERSNTRELTESQVQRVLPGWSWDGPSIPDMKPAIRSLNAMIDNRLWVLVSAPGELIPDAERDTPRPAAAGGPPPPTVNRWREPAWYDVFEPNGEFFARIAMPPRSRLLGARGDLAWGVVTDDDDIPFLVQWQITPATNEP